MRPRRSPLTFVALVFALSIPFWVLGAVAPLQLLPGLPVGALMLFAPLIAASMLVYREVMATGVIALLKRVFDFRRIQRRIWYVSIILLMPGVVLAFFAGAAAEEVGWSGYATDPLQERWGALGAVDPRLTTRLLAAAATTVPVLWGPRTLHRSPLPG